MHKIAAKEINDANSIGGRKIEIIAYEMKPIPQKILHLPKEHYL